MDTNRLVVILLGSICILLVIAIAVLQAMHIDPGIGLTASLSASLGALLALAHPPKG